MTTPPGYAQDTDIILTKEVLYEERTLAHREASPCNVLLQDPVTKDLICLSRVKPRGLRAVNWLWNRLFVTEDHGDWKPD